MADPKPGGLVQGRLHMLILKTLTLEPLHGYGIGVRLEQISGGGFVVNGGSLFPALRRLERNGLIRGEWRVTENNRRGKYYHLTRLGRAHFKSETRQWEAYWPQSPGFWRRVLENCDGTPAAHDRWLQCTSSRQPNRAGTG